MEAQTPTIENIITVFHSWRPELSRRYPPNIVIKNITPSKFDSAYVATASEAISATTNVARDTTAAETWITASSFRTRGVIPSIAATAIATNGVIPSPSRTRPKSSP